MIARRAVQAARWRRRLGAWLGLAALAPHLFLALVPALAQAAPAWAAAEGARFLCLAYSQGTAKPDTDREKGDTRSDCPVCLTKALGEKMLPASAAALPLPLALLAERPAAPTGTLDEIGVATRRLPRGPPRI